MKLEDINNFLELASTTQDGRNLALFWEQAYDQGYAEGRGDVLREELDMASEQLKNTWTQCGWDVGYEGYKQGKKEGHQDINIEAICTAAFEEGCVLGAANEKWLWETVGHDINNLGCTQLKSPPTSSVGVQSDAPCTTTTVSSSTQMFPPPLINVNTQTSVTMDPPSLVLPVLCLDWAEDATSLPIAPLLSTPLAPHRHAPCDFSGLCSSQPNPFSSLQHPSKQSHTQMLIAFAKKSLLLNLCILIINHHLYVLHLHFLNFRFSAMLQKMSLSFPHPQCLIGIKILVYQTSVRPSRHWAGFVHDDH